MQMLELTSSDHHMTFGGDRPNSEKLLQLVYRFSLKSKGMCFFLLTVSVGLKLSAVKRGDRCEASKSLSRPSSTRSTR
jgi:hypothetical protein